MYPGPGLLHASQASYGRLVALHDLRHELYTNGQIVLLRNTGLDALYAHKFR
jgi:hypothetical protein